MGFYPIRQDEKASALGKASEMSHSSNKCNSRPEIMEKLGYIYQKEQRGNKCRKNYSFWCFCVLEIEGTFNKFGEVALERTEREKFGYFFGVIRLTGEGGITV